VLLVAAALTGAMASKAWAHVAIVLTIVEPSTGQEVGADVTIVVHAQPTIGGVDGARFTLEVDGRALPGQVDRLIRVNRDVRIAVTGLTPGRHVATVRYRPDVDEPQTTNEVAFVVREPGDQGLPVPLVAALVGVAVVGGLIVWRRLIPRR
jgi:hypothetical protein